MRVKRIINLGPFKLTCSMEAQNRLLEMTSTGECSPLICIDKILLLWYVME